MNVTCSAEGCPVLLNGICVFYEGTTLLYTGITTNDNLQTALQKIDAKFADAAIGYAFNNGLIQSAPGQPVQLGGSLIQNTSIGGNYKLAFVGQLEASALITTGGTLSQFVKGDGSLDSTSYQPAGNYISNLTGDVIANGPGSVAATLATVFGAPGTYGNSGIIPSITVDSKGRVTNVTPVAVSYPSQSLSFVGDVDGAGFTGSPVTLTLDTVNTDVYGSNNFLKFAVNGKGLITSATPVSGGDITTALGYVPVDDAIELTINGIAHDLSANRSWSVGTVTTVGVTAGTGISASVSNPTTNPTISITNTAPDQIVVLNGGTGISISGSYPNFTVTNDYPSLGGTVTSFSAGNLSPLFTTSVTNPTTTPALSFALSSAAANTVFAAPNGGAGAPTFRALVAADIPSLSYISSISVVGPLASTGGLTPTLSISQANASTDGYLSSIDWNTFNNKQNALGYTPVPDSRQLTINGVVHDLTADRCWSVGTVTSITASAPLTGGTITGSGSVGITQAGAGSDGYLSSTDWNTFNSKQPAGSYITALTGDGTASGPGSACLTLATVNASTGTFGSSTQVPVITVNNKGLVTCVTTDTISGSLEFIGDVTGVGSTGTCTTLTLATVNNDVYVSETLLNVAVNGKGLITSANPTTSGDICSTLGYTPENIANKSTATSLGTSNTLYPTQLAVKTYVDNATAGGIILQGNWNAATNTPDITGTTTTGWAWRVDVAGTTNLGGITDWQVGDLAVKSATGWVKIDNTENVTSVFGRFGAIVATTGDYLSCQVTECGNLYYTDARVRAAVGHTAPLTYCSTTGVFGITQSNTTTDGYLSATDWNTFNDKQPLIVAGTTSQYYRGDKTFQTLDTSVVTEGTNLYFTDARARAAICAGAGISYNSTSGEITNSCPDQIVSLTGGGTTSITGTYPNFTITSNDSFTGTVTCVAVTGTNIGVTGSPITSAGTIDLSLSGANVCSALGYTPYNATNPAGYTTCVGTVTNVATCTSTTGVLLSGSPITSSGTLGIDIATASTICTGLLTAADWNTFNSHTGCTGTVTSVGLTSSTTGVSIACSPVTTSGTISLNIATASATCTGLLTSADWNTFNSHTGCTGTVTCVDAVGCNISVTGSPITTSGTLNISLSGSNVCSALGYTPYNATNPNGYTTCMGTVTSVGVVATNINVCNSPVTTSGNICLDLTGANVCAALGYSPAPTSSVLMVAGGGYCSTIRCGVTNSASGSYSAALGGASNSSVGTYSAVVAGLSNITQNTASFIGGGTSNSASEAYSTIAGGLSNTASGACTAVAGGQGNSATVEAAFVGGGSTNSATSNHAFVGGGLGNTASGIRSTVAGGRVNTASGNCSFIGGGCGNTASSYYSVAVGGEKAVASGVRSFTGSGYGAKALTYASIVVGGNYNCACGGCFNTVVGGNQNCVTATAGTGFGFIGGGCLNTVSGGYASLVVGGCENNASNFRAAIVGGYANTASGIRSFVGAGASNTASGYASTISGGQVNAASGCRATISGGESNTASGGWSSVGGGLSNVASGNCSSVSGGQSNIASGSFSAVVGGCANCATRVYSFVGGGRANKVFGDDGTIGGGYNNCIGLSGTWGTVSGGYGNCATGQLSSVGGGYINSGSGYRSAISGGQQNNSSGNHSFVGGGISNTAQGNCSFVGGGQSNTVTTQWSTLVGGCGNSISGNRAFLGGGFANTVSGSYFASLVGGNSNTASGYGAFIGGGSSNTACGCRAVVTGGQLNSASGNCSAVLGGQGNTASGAFSGAFGCGLTASAACTFYVNNLCSTNAITTPTSCVTGLTTGCAVCVGTSGLLTGYTPSAGGGGIIVAGGGSCSTLRCGVSNSAGGIGSAALGGCFNFANGDNSFIGGGCFNNTGCGFSTVAGGQSNCACACAATVAGGRNNKALSTGSFIGGGGTSFCGNTASGTYSVVVGGACANVACGSCTFIGGGLQNCACGSADAIVAGWQNLTCSTNSTFIGNGFCNVSCSAFCTTIVNGNCNFICFPGFSHISTGTCNRITNFGSHNIIGGGYNNIIEGCYGYIGNGYSSCVMTCGNANIICCGTCAGTILNGTCNRIATSFGTNGCNNTITGGCANVICGSYAISHGQQNTVCCCFSGAFGCFNNVGANGAYAFGSFITNNCANSVQSCFLRANSLFTNGIVYSNTCTLTNTNPSDRTLKCNITASTYGLCELKQLNPVRYKWIGGNESCNLGFIAQEVKEVLPSFVGENEDKTLGLYSDRFTPLTVKAVQELNDKLDAQEQRIAILEDIIKRNNLI